MLNTYDSMKAISLRAAGTAVNFRILAANAWRIFTQHNLTISVIGAALCFMATVAGAETTAAVAAFAALAGVYPSAAGKGGEL